mmetsp:Transcript_23505/g.51377  ORF Transcript_23505/g.51377 Transcript_23505/m.51377 type:complete len:487 (-) Transcript_23505:546-2006(-)
MATVDDMTLLPVPMEEEAPKRGVVDYSKLDEQIAELKTLAKTDLEEALEKLLALEKTHRLGADMVATKKVCIGIVQVCYFSGNFKLLNEHIVLLSKRRSQLKQAVVGLVQEAMSYIDQVKDVDTKTELISTLNTVTAGKIYVEVERARLVRQLVKIKEAQGDIEAAAEAIQEVAVETYGAMAKTEKIEFILEQVRLCLDCKDFVRGTIMSKKISARTFAEKPEPKPDDKKKGAAHGKDQQMPEAPALEGTASMSELKIRYYELLIRIQIHNSDYLEICRAYQSVFADKTVSEDPTKWPLALKKICWYIVLAPHGVEQQTLLHGVAGEKRLSELVQYHSLIKQFTTMEVIRWPVLKVNYQAEFTEIFSGEDAANMAQRLTDLQQRVVEHNILVICKYYKRITLVRLSELLDLDLAPAEKHISDMVVKKMVKAKIDRPAGIVDFEGKKDAAEVLNAWANNIERVLNLVDLSCHQIHKECMTHKVPIGV